MATKRERGRAHDRRRAADQTWRKLYSTKEWKQARAEQLERMPWCERCWRAGHGAVAAGVVNHRRPHKGDWQLFFDPENHESVCKRCHDGPIQREERRPVYASEDDARRAYLARRRNLLKTKGFRQPKG